MKATETFLAQRYGSAIPQTLQERQDRAVAAAWESLSAALMDKLPEEAGYYAKQYETWQPGQTYKAGQLLQYEGVALQVRQQVTAQAHQSPFSQGMTAIYIPIVTADQYGVKPYKYGVATKQGERFYGADGEVYVHIAVDNPSNVYPPSSDLPAVWKKEENR